MDRKEVIVTERPETVSWDEISSVLKRAHEKNVRRGIIMAYPHLPSDALRDMVERRNGKMFVALCDGKVVATAAARIRRVKFWFGWRSCVYIFLGAVLPEYSGTGIYGQLARIREQYARDNGIDMMMFDTNVKNRHMLWMSIRNGFRPVDYRVLDDHQSYVMVKWLDGCPYSWYKCWRMLSYMKRQRFDEKEQQNQ